LVFGMSKGDEEILHSYLGEGAVPTIIRYTL
jgi:hypothetical protein